MREIDRRSRVSRRSFLRGSATALPAAALAAAGASISPEAAWAQDAKALRPATMATLVLMARDIYPHDRIADLYYVRAVGPWDGKAAADPKARAMLEDGVARLDQDAQDMHGMPYLQVPWEEQRVAILQRSEDTPFFKAVRADLVTSFYNQHELWAKFGYEGSSAEHGGYIHRGFDDINWLPRS